MSELPTGTITFLFTDIRGSTKLWEEHPTAMKAALARHDTILREAIEAIPELQAPGKTSLRPGEIAACFRLKLWDPRAQRMVGFPEDTR